MASIAPKTPTTPSYFPEKGIASICDPVAIAETEESLPSLSIVRNTERVRRDTNMMALQLHDTILFSTHLSITSHRSHEMLRIITSDQKYSQLHLLLQSIQQHP